MRHSPNGSLPSVSPGRSQTTRYSPSSQHGAAASPSEDMWPSNPHAIKARFAASSSKAVLEGASPQLFAAVYSRTRDIGVDASQPQVTLVDACVETEADMEVLHSSLVTTGTDPDPACGGPLQPTITSVNGSRQGELSVTWQPPDILPAPTTQLSYKVFAKSTSDSFLTKTLLAPWGATSAALRGLAGGHVYAVTVVLVVHETIPSAPVTGTFHAFRPPAPPLDVTVLQVPSRGMLDVRWRRPTRSAGQAAVTGYVVHAIPEGKPVVIPSAEKTSATLTMLKGALKGGKSYYIRVYSTSDDADNSVPVTASLLPMAKDEWQPQEPPPVDPTAQPRRKGKHAQATHDEPQGGLVLFRDYNACEACGEPVTRPFLFCRVHRCELEGCAFSGPACQKHCCRAHGCARPIGSEKSSYCLQHGCRNPTCFEMAQGMPGAQYCSPHTCGEADCLEPHIGGMDVLAKCCIAHSLTRIDARIRTIIGAGKIDTERNKNVLTDKSKSMLNAIAALFAGVDPALHAIRVVGRSNPPEGKDRNNQERKNQWAQLAKERAEACIEHMQTVCALSNEISATGEIGTHREVAFVITSPVLEERQRRRDAAEAAAAAAVAAASAPQVQVEEAAEVEPTSEPPRASGGGADGAGEEGGEDGAAVAQAAEEAAVEG